MYSLSFFLKKGNLIESNLYMHKHWMFPKELSFFLWIENLSWPPPQTSINIELWESEYIFFYLKPQTHTWIQADKSLFYI